MCVGGGGRRKQKGGGGKQKGGGGGGTKGGGVAVCLHMYVTCKLWCPTVVLKSGHFFVVAAVHHIE